VLGEYEIQSDSRDCYTCVSAKHPCTAPEVRDIQYHLTSSRHLHRGRGHSNRLLPEVEALRSRLDNKGGRNSIKIGERYRHLGVSEPLSGNVIQAQLSREPSVRMVAY
jgi:hypothetical protein